MLRSALFWDFMQHRMVVCYRRFGTTYRSHLQGSSSLRRMLPTFRDNLSVPSSRASSPRTIYAASYPRLAHISLTPRRKPEITHVYSGLLNASLKRPQIIISSSSSSLAYDPYFNQFLLQNDRAYRSAFCFLPPSLDTHQLQIILNTV